MRLFADDDAGYARWLADHPEGFIVNTYRTPMNYTVVIHCREHLITSPDSREGTMVTCRPSRSPPATRSSCGSSTTPKNTGPSSTPGRPGDQAPSPTPPQTRPPPDTTPP